MNPAVLRTAIRCKSCSTPMVATRSLSTTIRRSNIKPESPKFIEIPQPPQQRAPVPRIIRGTLPPPRDVFASRGGKDKTTAEYLRQTIPAPASTKYFARDEQAAWKRRMAVTRRRNLQEGLEALNTRRIQKDASLNERSRKRMAWRDKMVYYTPPRPDEVLTSSTVTEAMRWVQNGPLPDPDREARVAAKIASVQAKEAEREAARRDALHSLYMHARNFITTEDQLDARIEELFQETPFRHPNGDPCDNIWDAKSAPPTVQDMLSPLSKSEKKSVDFHKGHFRTTAKRVLRIAEELTGGKMDTKEDMGTK